MDPQVFRLILDVTRRLASSSDLQEVLALIVDSLRDALKADRASVFQYDAAPHQFIASHAHGLPTTLRLPADAGIIGEAGKSRQIVNIPDAYADARFNRAVDQKSGYRTRCMLTIPLTDPDGALVGVAQVLNKSLDQGGVFNQRDLVVARHLADQAAVALKRASLLESERVKRKLEQDLDVARKIQQSSMPEKMPELTGYEIAAHFAPAEETAGDAFDVIDLRQGRYGSAGSVGDALVFMADATGHGIGPALSVAQVLSMIRMGARLGAPLPRIAQHVNHQVCLDLPVGRFVTAFMGVLDAGAHTLRYFSAGQAPILFFPADAGADSCIERNATTMPLGIDPDMVVEDAPSFTFGPGDAFVMLSDGYYEAMSPGGEMFGIQRVQDIVRAHQHESAGRIVAALRRALDAFIGENALPQDDQTALIIRRAE